LSKQHIQEKNKAQTTQNTVFVRFISNKKKCNDYQFKKEANKDIA
jgi:hypothetical protein